MLGLAGATPIVDKVAEVTVNGVLVLMPPKVATIVAVPGARAAARPVLSTVATNIFVVRQATCVVIL